MTRQTTADTTTGLRKELAELNQNLEANNLALEEAQALTHLGSWQWTIATNTITWSDELYRIYGLKPQEREIDFENFIKLIHPDDQERVQGIIGSAYQTGDPFEFEHRILLPNGKLRILSGKGKSIKAKDGTMLRMLGTSQDITEQKKADQALHLSDERFRAVSAATNDIVYDFDVTTDTVWFNDVLHSRYGYSAKDVENTHNWLLKHIHNDDRDRIEESIKKFLQDHTNTWEAEYRLRRHDGTYADVRDRAYVIRDHTGAALRMIGSALDITEQKELERAKDEFISLASHQLRTPATAVKQYLGMIQDGYAGEVPDQVTPFVRTAFSANERQLTIINDLLKTAQLESGQDSLVKQPHILSNIIQDIIELYKPVVTMRKQHIVFHDTPLEPIAVDESEFKIAVSNLVENASKYSPEYATITVSVQKTAKQVLITIQDQGVGIKHSDIPKVFDKFTRLDNELSDTVDGSGLGLYFVKKIITLHGGTIAVQSKIGNGSTFTIKLPS